jgi:hypothetical protein
MCLGIAFYVGLDGCAEDARIRWFVAEGGITWGLCASWPFGGLTGLQPGPDHRMDVFTTRFIS